jgi:2,4-dienoyl-CoA reductase-like NADH-dependent reductase (Old Yellow Enzyme family)
MLHTPLTFPCGAVAANRVVLAPLTNKQSHDDGSLSDAERRWLTMRAAGGFGVITTAAAYVSPEGKAWPGQVGVYADHCVAPLAALARDLLPYGALGVVQLHHGGIRAKREASGLPTVGPSALTDIGEGYEPPRAATEDDIARFIRDFRDAAARAEAAGLAGVELHAAHGYLLGQFLSSTLNLRADAWGGDLPNRARLLREVARAVRAAVSPGFIVGARLSPEDFGFAAGIDLDETIQVAQWLAEDGIDYIHLSLWDAAANTKKRPDVHALPLFRAALPASLPIVVAGSVWTPDQAAHALSLGADMVALGRAAIAHPDWPHRAVDPTWSPRRPPFTADELAARGLSPIFVDYMRRWRGFVEP